MKKRERPRTCVGCGEEKPKKEMLRIVKTPEGDVQCDVKGHLPGRGAYLCFSEECFLKAKKKKGFSRFLKTEVPAAVYEDILKVIKEHCCKELPHG